MMQYKTGITATIFITLATCCISEYESGDWIEFETAGYQYSEKLDLSHGVNTNNYKYDVHGVASVETSAPRWPDKEYHFLSNVFDGSLYHRTHGDKTAYSTWLGNCPTSQTSTMTIKFDKVQDISHIIVAQKGHWGNSLYSIDGYRDEDANNDDVTEAIHITSMINTNNDIFGQVRAHSVKQPLRELVFYIYKTSTYCEMNEIEIFVRKDV
eukprot:431535_1